jgi:hypothetical protein
LPSNPEPGVSDQSAETTGLPAPPNYAQDMLYLDQYNTQFRGELETYSVENALRQDRLERRRLDPYREYPPGAFKRGRILREDAIKFIQEVGRDRVGLLTLTLRRKHSPGRRARLLNRIFRRFFPELFGRMMWVLGKTRRGCPHYHFLVECRFPLIDGFSFEALRDYERGCNQARCDQRPLTWKVCRELRNKTTCNKDLLELWRILDRHLPRFGFGKVYDLFPLKESAEVVAGYLERNFFLGTHRRAHTA